MGIVMVTLKEVSKYAKVNPSTISRYLSNKLKVKPETERRILEAIRETNYRPNYVARALKTNSTLNIGVIAPSGSNPLFAEIISGIGTVLSRNEFTFFLVTSENKADLELAGLHTLHSKLVDGVIILNSNIPCETFIDLADEKAIKEEPLVFVNSMYSCEHFARVLSNFAQGAYDATSHLINCGRKNIGMITGRVAEEESDIKKSGYKRALEEHGILLEERKIIPGGYNFDGGYKAAKELIEKFAPDAIFAANDLMAIAAMRCAANLGISVPEKLAVIGYGNTDASQFTTPMLSTVDQQKLYSGECAAELLLLQMETGQRLTKHIDTNLIIRESS